MRLTLLAVGHLKAGPERELVERYRGRIDALSRGLGLTPLAMVEIAESRARREADRRAEEGNALLSKANGALVVVLDERGESLTSAALAARIIAWRDGGRDGLAWIVGGPDGLDGPVRNRADLLLSFGALTLPHQLVRVLVAEQIYRVLTILAGHPYHRAGRDHP
jgi:23S rRNA (pseudouridine1915-N3)-methyltransferase